MPKICSCDGCSYPVFGGGFCKVHQYLRVGKKPQVFKKSKPRQVSKKLGKELSRYSVLRKEYLSEHSECEISEKCNRAEATDIHHTKGRGKYLNDTSTWKSSCRECHDWVHDNPLEAEKKGWWVPISKR